MRAAAIVIAARGPSKAKTGRRKPQRSERAERSERTNSDQAHPCSASSAPVPTSRIRAARERAERIKVPRTERPQQIVQSSDGPRRNFGRRNRMTTDRRRRRAGNGGEPRHARMSVTNWRSRERRAARIADQSDDHKFDQLGRLRSRESQTGDDHLRARRRPRHWDRDRDGRRRWSSDWRRDNRYDWRRHRSRYSSLFRLGRYYDPYSYGYRRFSIGLTLGSAIIEQQFLAQRPVAVSPAAGVRPVSLGALL